MEVGGLVALLLILAVLPIGYADVKGHTDFRRLTGSFSSRMSTCRENCCKAPKAENYLTW
ncbi:MAG: hypothetical protein VR68_09700 [Peptococcaceae bacterium BRH_c4a]|nr:MAG: hypothetical protein VR68_09700 [Peptococcaceae bacterium BRH_c4a]